MGGGQRHCVHLDPPLVGKRSLRASAKADKCPSCEGIAGDSASSLWALLPEGEEMHQPAVLDTHTVARAVTLCREWKNNAASEGSESARYCRPGFMLGTNAKMITDEFDTANVIHYLSLNIIVSIISLFTSGGRRVSESPRAESRIAPLLAGYG